MTMKPNAMITDERIGSQAADTPGGQATVGLRLVGKRTGMVVFSSYPADPRPRRAAEALLREGMHVDLICESDERLPKREKNGELEIFRLPIKHERGGKLSYAFQYVAFILMSAGRLAAQMLKHRYDLIYVHNMPDVLVYCAVLPRMLGAKVILDQHDPMPELMNTIFDLPEDSAAVRLIRWLEKRSIGFADRVITVNLACKKIFSARSGGEEKVGVVMNAPDGDIFPYRAARSYAVRDVRSTKPFVIMYHGSLVERNGLELALDALAVLQNSMLNAELRVYGRSTPYLERVLEKAGRLGIADRVRYLGPKRLEELVGEIEACDVGVIPNQRNSFTDINTPTRIFEYLALGKTLIAPRTPGIQDYFGAQELLFFDSGDAAQLADQIQYVYSNPREAMDITERGQQVYLAHTWQKEREILITVVSELVKGKGDRE